MPIKKNVVLYSPLNSAELSVTVNWENQACPKKTEICIMETKSSPREYWQERINLSFNQLSQKHESDRRKEEAKCYNLQSYT